MHARDDPIPPLTPRYEPLRELGRGGLGRVLLVRDRHLGREVALKLLLARPDDEAIEAFRKEFALLSEIEHPGIARAFDFGYAGKVPFYTSEFIEGTSLDRGVTPGDAGRLLARAREVAEALAFLHAEGILHLDVKPGNILVPGPPREGRAVLIDFGLFRRGLAGPPGDRIQGSLAYMAPEYFRGGRLGPWTDVYAFGVTLYKLLASRLPRTGAWAGRGTPHDPSAWDPAPPPPSRFSASTPAALDAIALRCLALDPEARYASAAGIVEALERISACAPGTARPAGTAAATTGRVPELERFDAFLRDFRPGGAAAGEGPPGLSAVLITGAPGMGQSHLIRDMKVRAQTLGVPFYLETGYPGRPTVPGSVLRCLTFLLEDRQARARWRVFLERVRRPRASPRSETSEAERRLRRAAEVSLAVSSARAFILAVDGLQFFDEVSIGLVLDLVRLGGGHPRVGLVLGYREEGPSAGLLRELSDELSRREATVLLALRPLGIDAAWSLYRSRAPGAKGRAMDVYRETAGVPARVAALAASEGEAPGSPGPPSARPPGVIASVGADERTCLLVLDLLGRPAGAPELARMAGLSRTRVLACLGRLEERGLASGASLREGRREWVIERGAADIARGADPAELRALHRRIAEDLAGRARAPADPRAVEIARHFEEARMPAASRRFSLAAARYLRSTLQSRAALDRYRAALDAVPARQRGRRIDLALEMAALQARIGDHEAGIESLKELLAASKGSSPSERARILLWLATLHGRKGELRRAAGLFEEGFRLAGRPLSRRPGRARKPAPRRDEMLYFLNELASLRTFTGDYREAARLCEEGFRLAGRRRSFSVRELVINLHATRGNVALRTFDYVAACRSLETALEIAEAIGSPESQAVILNNLGIALASLDRYRDAIQAYRAAEKLSLRLDEGPSLVSIHGNLAILHAKTGDWPAMEEALAAGERMGAAAIGIKQELFLAHARGLCLLYRGRFREARHSLEAAIRLGEKVGDPFVAAFDSVYRAEAALHEGAYGEARRQLEDLSARDHPARVRRMALSRLALLHAITGRGDLVKACASRLAAGAADRPVPFLDAWDGLHLGWALSMSLPDDDDDDGPSALALLEGSAAFFREHAAAPGAALAEWALAERAFLRGDLEGARRILSGMPAAGNELTSILVPLLASRVAGELAAAPHDLEGCADLLAGAGEKIAANALPEWRLRFLALRSALAAPAGPPGKEIEEERRRLARELPAEDRRRWLESPHWRRWVEEFRIPLAAGRRPPAPGEGGAEEEPPARTASLHREGGGPSRRGVIARSPAMKEVLSFLDRIRDSELPVLIEGETGSGKEMIARIIHQESRRSAGPFVVVDCAAIPEALVDAELHGAVAGAFTDSRTDRPGLISAAAGGTLLVDEVARIPPGIQGKLLRAVSEGRFRRIGDEAESAADVRFLFTSSLDVEEEAAAGRLRRDLYHRIQVLRVRVPPLRERREDIPLLVERILEEGKVPPPVLGQGVLERFGVLPWPGNVRELRNALARLSLEGSRRISLEALEAHAAGRGAADLFPRRLLEREDLPALKQSLEREYVLHHLARLRGDTAALSRFLGISRLQLYRRCHRLGIRLRRTGKGPL